MEEHNSSTRDDQEKHKEAYGAAMKQFDPAINEPTEANLQAMNSAVANFYKEHTRQLEKNRERTDCLDERIQQCKEIQAKLAPGMQAWKSDPHLPRQLFEENNAAINRCAEQIQGLKEQQAEQAHNLKRCDKGKGKLDAALKLENYMAASKETKENNKALKLGVKQKPLSETNIAAIPSLEGRVHGADYSLAALLAEALNTRPDEGQGSLEAKAQYGDVVQASEKHDMVASEAVEREEVVEVEEPVKHNMASPEETEHEEPMEHNKAAAEETEHEEPMEHNMGAPQEAALPDTDPKKKMGACEFCSVL